MVLGRDLRYGKLKGVGKEETVIRKYCKREGSVFTKNVDEQDDFITSISVNFLIEFIKSNVGFFW